MINQIRTAVKKSRFRTIANEKELVGINTFYSRYKGSAKESGLNFGLTESQFYDLIKSDCYYCGSEPQERRLALNRVIAVIYATGIDRMDNSQGYVIQNCVPCCEFCNRAKLNHPVDYFLRKVTEIFLYSKLNPLEFV